MPRLLDEVISVTPAMRPNWRSSGVATEAAMVSGLAPGRLALTEMVGIIDLRQRRNGQDVKGDAARQRDERASAGSCRSAGG